MAYSTLPPVSKASAWDMQKQAMHFLEKLCATPTTHVFGICRLHKHYDVFEGECVVTYLDNGALRSVVEPLSPNVVPWQWKYSVETEQWVPTEYFRPLENFDPEQYDVSKVGSTLLPFIKDCGEEAFNQYGVCLNFLHLYNLEVKDGFVMLETTNKKART